MLRPLKKCQKSSDHLPLHAQQRPQPALSENFIRSENRWKLAKLLQCQDAIYVCMYVCMYMYFCMRMACKYFCPVLTFFCPYMCPLYVFFICICMYRRRKVNSKLTQWTRRDYHFDRHSLCHTPIETHTYVHICTYTRMYVCIQTYDAQSKDTYIMLGAASWRLVLFTHNVHLASALNESVCLFPNQSLCLSLPVIQTCLPYSLSGERQTKQIPHARERERERDLFIFM